MLHSLLINNSFAHKKKLYNFGPGLINIAGLNGTGKTELIDIIQWLLWGSKALRGDADDYKHYDASLTFEVKGGRYVVSRNKSVCVLQREGGDMARGTKPVNTAIQRIFGYSYEVFQMANVSRQGEAQKLCDLPPARRKEMVDQTIGLSRLDGISKWAKGEVSSLNTTLDMLNKYMKEPVPCVADPDPSVTVENIKDRRASFQAEQTAWIRAKAVADQPVVECVPHPRWLDLASIKRQQEDRFGKLAVLARLLAESVNYPHDAPQLVELHPRDGELDALKEATGKHLWNQQQINHLAQQVAAIPDAAYTARQLDEMTQQHELFGQHLANARAKDAYAAHKLTCPNCHHEWAGDGSNFVLPFPDAVDMVAMPKLSLPKIAEARKALEQQAVKASLVQRMTELSQNLGEDHSGLTKEIEQLRNKHQKYLQAQGLYQKGVLVRDQIAELQAETPVDQAHLIEDIERNISEMDSYREKLRAKEAAEAELSTHNTHGYGDVLESLETLLGAKTAYEADKVRFDKEQADYVTMKAEQEATSGKIKQYQGVAAAIAAMRLKVKNQLIPNLNIVASRLLSSMSNGWLNSVVVTEDFDIYVDNKKVHKLSGAGRDLTNLAVRVALGLVLTNGVFSVLMLDEVDQGVDVEKAPHLAEALKRLTASVKQIVQISHKGGLIADQRIELT